MPAFPQLKTSAVMQYPALDQTRYSTEIVRFLDGSEQRWRQQGAGQKRWLIRLDQLDDQEMARLEAFVKSLIGRQGTFSFQDPRDGTDYGSCSLESDTAEFRWVDFEQGRTALWIRQNWS